MRRNELIGNQIHVETIGEGEPALLFVHGFCCDSTDWSGLVERLSDRFRCITVDLPGHGRSASTAATMAAAGAAVNEAKARSGSDKVIVIGHSLGTKVIREAHRQSPDGVVGMILVDGSLYVSDRQTMLDNANAAVSVGMEAFLRGLFARMFDADSPPAELDRLTRRALDRDLDFARALFLDSVNWDSIYARRTIEALSVPALVIQATTFDSHFRWQLLPPGETTSLIETMRSIVPDFDAVVVPNAGHFVMHDAPDVTAETIATFASRMTEKA
ncbi:alpha/beta fold hydrolase [Noviherbaspirillum sedimenti]|uniref:alpha/beta fold hydrolase n=1 Tax=Noviherbaspirillum sedimenti TaxID=2320865 RepID=UPI00131499FB|nr:alpha/beta hydrolase [Noviherbaspirillum sedimenti]